MLSINKNTVKYSVNEEKRTIVAYVEGTSDMFIDFFLENCGPKERLTSDEYNRLSMPDRFIGVAVCSEDDEWNEELGKRIAMDRLKDKINRSFYKRSEIYYEMMDNDFVKYRDCLDNYLDKLEAGSDYRKSKIAKELNEYEG